jgi:group I intron endonuclease
MPAGYVYKIANPMGNIYIGSTNNIKKRKNAYKNGRCKNQVKIYRSIVKYGFDAHEFTVILKCDINSMRKCERLLGDFYKCMERANGLNIKLPGYDNVKEIMNQESRKIIGCSNRGKIQSKESRNLVSANNNRLSPTKETINKLRIKQCRAIIQKSLDGKIIREYLSPTEAFELTGIKRTTIKECLNGRNKTAAGFIWEYADNMGKKQTAKKVAKKDFKTGDILAIFNTIREAAKSVDLDDKSISRVVNGNGFSAAGFNWVFV